MTASTSLPKWRGGGNEKTREDLGVHHAPKKNENNTAAFAFEPPPSAKKKKVQQKKTRQQSMNPQTRQKKKESKHVQKHTANGRKVSPGFSFETQSSTPPPGARRFFSRRPSSTRRPLPSAWQARRLPLLSADIAEGRPSTFTRKRKGHCLEL